MDSLELSYDFDIKPHKSDLDKSLNMLREINSCEFTEFTEEKIEKVDIVKIVEQAYIIKTEEVDIKTESCDSFEDNGVKMEHSDEDASMTSSLCKQYTFQTRTTPSGVPVYMCEQCDYQTKYRCAINRHMLRHNNNPEVYKFKCDTCPFVTKHRKSLKRHLIKHEVPPKVATFKKNLLTKPSDGTGYVCEQCDYVGQYKSDMARHMLRHNDTLEVYKFKCDVCPFVTKHGKSLKRHMIKHEVLPKKNLVTKPSDVMNYTCKQCDYVAKYKSDMDTHMLRHNDIPDVYKFKCDVCPFITKREKRLKYHFRIKHMVSSNVSKLKIIPTEVAAYACKYCEYLTKFRGYMTRHMVCHNTPEVYRFKCEICPFVTKHAISLERHTIKHQVPTKVPTFKKRLIHNVTDYMCEECDYVTKYKRDISRHMLCHDNTPEMYKFKCDICPFATKHDNSLKRHRKAKHAIFSNGLTFKNYVPKL